MTLPPWLPGLAAGTWRWLRDHPVAMLLVVVALLVAHDLRTWRRAAEAEAAVARGRQEAASPVPVVQQVTPEEVEDQGEQLEHDDPVLAAKLKEAEAKIGKLRTLLAARIKTEPGVVNAPPATPPAVAPGAPPPRCDLYAGEQLLLGAALELKQGTAGAVLMVGDLTAERVADRQLLLRQPFSQETEAKGVAPGATPAPLSSWRWGPQAGYSPSGWLAGLLVLTPEIRLPLIKVKTGWSFTGAAGPGGIFVLTGPTF